MSYVFFSPLQGAAKNRYGQEQQQQQQQAGGIKGRRGKKAAATAADGTPIKKPRKPTPRLDAARSPSLSAPLCPLSLSLSLVAYCISSSSSSFPPGCSAKRGSPS